MNMMKTLMKLRMKLRISRHPTPHICFKSFSFLSRIQKTKYDSTNFKMKCVQINILNFSGIQKQIPFLQSIWQPHMHIFLYNAVTSDYLWDKLLRKMC